jgi:hypothetical protein
MNNVLSINYRPFQIRLSDRCCKTFETFRFFCTLNCVRILSYLSLSNIEVEYKLMTVAIIYANLNRLLGHSPWKKMFQTFGGISLVDFAQTSNPLEKNQSSMSHIEERNHDNTVFVGDLDQSVDESLLWELMVQVGPVGPFFCNGSLLVPFPALLKIGRVIHVVKKIANPIFSCLSCFFSPHSECLHPKRQAYKGTQSFWFC